MKKRIIASILALVMTVLALVSCGAGFNFAEDSDDFATVKLAEFKAALAAIEIEDADFTTDEATRLEKVLYNLYTTLTDAAVKEDDKQTVGSLSSRDVLYFCYYATYTEGEGDDAKTYYFFTDQMKTSAITSGTTTSKANHVIKLAVVADNEDDKYGNALYEALIAKYGENFLVELKNESEENPVDKLYSSTTTKGTKVKEGNTVFISYTRKPVVADGASDEEIKAAKEEKVLYEMIVLDKDKYAEGSANDALVELMLKEGVTATVGNDVSETVTTGEGSSATTSTKKVFRFTVDGKEYDYSEIGVEWISEDYPHADGAFVEFKYTPYTATNKLEPDNLHESDMAKIDLKDKELTYHVFPVNYIEVPELNANTILKELIGKKITVDSLDVLSDESYKNGDVTVKALVETLAKLWADDAETIKSFTNEAGDKTLEELKKAIDDAKKAHEDAEDDESHDHTALNKVVSDAEEAYNDAKDYALDTQIAKIVAAKKTVDSVEKTVADAVWQEYAGKDGVIYKNLKSTYDTAIVDAIGKEVWKLIEKYVTVNSYPEEMVEEFYDHLYEAYEYDFYKGTDSTSKKSNYLEYDGDFEKFLLKKTDASKHNNDIEAAITAEAKEFLKPILQVYALAIALANDADTAIADTMKNYVELDKAGGAYDVLNDELDEDERAEQEAAAKEAYEKALEDSADFLITDEVFKAYKKQLGNSTYKDWESQYGEVNIRAALQSNRVMYYLLATNIQLNADGDAVEVKYEEKDGKQYIDFRTVSYTIKVEDTEADEAEDAE